MLDNGADDWLLRPSDSVRTPSSLGGLSKGLVVVVAAIVLLTAAVLFRSPTQAVEGIGEGLITPTTAAPTLQPTASSAAVGEDSTTEEAADGESQPTDGAQTLAPGVVALDGLEGHYIVVAVADAAQRIDVDTGEVRFFKPNGQLIGHHNGNLIAIDSDLRLLSIPVDDPGPGQVIFKVPEIRGEMSMVTMSDTGQVDFGFVDFESTTGIAWTSVHIDLNTLESFVGEVGGYNWSPYGLVAASGGGLFEISGRGFRPLTDGAVVAFGARYIIVEQCSDPLSCQRFWFDRKTGDEIDRPLPEVQSDGGSLVLGEQGRIVSSFSFPTSRFFDTKFGRYLPSDIQMQEPSGEFFMVAESVSPDGRYLAGFAQAGNDLLLYDLDNEVAVEVPLELDSGSVMRPQKSLIVPKPG